ncbi:MAG TPA: maltotransferase domain-containing protein, partial [Acidimicrobiales bacterium]|nr:maltotransferase domain-containing protein [Acidimicrobiales bacterium]
MIGRIVIDDVRPRTPSGRFPAKAVVGEAVRVSADVFKEGHDRLAGRVRWRPEGGKWAEAPLHDLGNDRFMATMEPATLGRHEVVVEAWTDEWATWRHRVTTKLGVGDDVELELEEGARLLAGRAMLLPEDERGPLLGAARAARSTGRPVPERLASALAEEVAAAMAGPLGARDLTGSAPTPLWVDRPRALVGAWYELFPRSEGGLAGAGERLRAVADMGFDVVYLPPVHPIGATWRKGRDNALVAGPGDPGSPWAIGGPEGGHTEVHPDLGTLDDLASFLDRASSLGLEVALDYALQCSPDHPWVRDHPEWFHHRPDGSIAYAENPPKKYQDIVPINFWPEREADRAALWQACRDVLTTWIARGVRIYRVDNPHTKPMAFWAWLIPSVQAEHPDVVFLSEAFTRPKVMAKLAEVGFSQSYTYFTWRTSASELRAYATELTQGPLADYFRPSFWPNTPDILAGPPRRGPRPAFKSRLVLAATLVPSYGLYSGYELEENEPASETTEEYAHSEKYEI